MHVMSILFKTCLDNIKFELFKIIKVIFKLILNYLDFLCNMITILEISQHTSCKIFESQNFKEGLLEFIQVQI